MIWLLAKHTREQGVAVVNGIQLFTGYFIFVFAAAVYVSAIGLLNSFRVEELAVQ
jgi:hypothetical protein